MHWHFFVPRYIEFTSKSNSTNYWHPSCYFWKAKQNLKQQARHKVKTLVCTSKYIGNNHNNVEYNLF